MIVCHCHAVTDREIRRAAAESGKDCRLIAERCGAGSGCRGCVPTIQTLLRNLDARREHRGPRLRPQR